MTILLTLTTAGNDTDSFDLYTDLDGFIFPFEAGVPKALLVAGYSSSLAPDGASIVRVQSTVGCVSYVDIELDATNTTTTTTTLTTTTTAYFPLGCFEYVVSTLSSFPELVTWTDCNDTEQTITIGGVNPISHTFCARLNSIIHSGAVYLTSNGSCTL
jgi:hypothetical protein